MKKLDHIDLQGTLFPIETKAFITLDEYLRSIREYFASFEESQEIIDDIESRIAEKFSTEILTKKHKTITSKDVQTVINSIGKVEDMDTETKNSANTQRDEPEINQETQKRFYRNPDGALVGGVATGLAHYFNVDTTIVRVIFVASLLLGGYSLVLYLVLWLITPEAKTPTQKMQMHGHSVTLSSLEKNLKREIDKLPVRTAELKKKSERFIKQTTPAQSIIVSLIKNTCKVIGAIIFVTMLVSLVALFFGLIGIFLNLQHPYVDPAIPEITQALSEPWIMPTLFSSLFLIAAVPLWFIMFLGQKLFQWDKNIQWPLLIIALLLWLSSIGTVSVLAVMYGPKIEAKTQMIISQRQKEYQAQRSEKSYQYTDFNQLHISGESRVEIHQGPFQVKTSGPNTLLETISIRQDSEILSIDTTQSITHPVGNCWIGCEQQTTTIEVWLPELSSLIINDAAIVKTQEDTTINSTQPVTININDGGLLTLSLTAPELILIQKDSTSTYFSGSIATLSATLEDSSRTDLSGINIIKATATTRDSSMLHIQVSKTLMIDAYDSSYVYYTGSPSETQLNQQDSATITKNDYYLHSQENTNHVSE